MNKQLLFIIFLIFSNVVYSQTTINGKLTDEAGKPVSNASVVVNKTGTDELIAYCITKGNGTYNITCSSSEINFDIQIKSMGYKTITETIKNKNQTKNFKLKEEAFELKEVTVKAPPITRKGDTINYLVSSFAKGQDRSIADVLERLPGIEVLSNGTVKYQGKAINKYYTEGLDLLEGKYNIANKNLPYKEVSQIQILENHQPIKILDSLEFSDRAALNIKLKNKYTFTGKAELGAGFSPLLWDANITPMLFSRGQQMISSYQSNNIGNNVASQLKTLTIEDLLDQFENNIGEQNWLSIQRLSTPNFSEKRWLDNNINLITSNYLRKLKKDYEIRLNVSYLNDYQQQNGSTNTLYLISTDTISTFENKYNQLYYNQLETKLTLQKNTKNNYLKNILQFQGYWNDQRGNIQLDNEPLTQNLNNKYFKLSNKFKNIFPLGKQLMTLNSYIRLNKTPQTLQVNPGQFDELLNNGDSYDEVFQEIDLKTFYTNNAIRFTKGWKWFSFSPKLGFQFEKQNLQSQITTSENKTLPDEFTNDLDWTRSKLYLELQTQFKKDKLRIELNTPFNIHNYRVEDSNLQKKDDLKRLTFDPKLSIIYDATAYWKFNSSVGLNNQFGTIDQLHYAYILQNYRNIQRENTPLPETSSKTFVCGISYRNPIKSLFGNIFYTIIGNKNNLLYKTEISDNGATEIQAIEQDNNMISHNVTSQLSKYFSKISTNFSVNSGYYLTNSQQILNTEITDIENQSWSIGGKIEPYLSDLFSVEYNAKWILSKSKIQNSSNKTITQQNHLINLNFYPSKNQYFTIKTEYIKNNLFSKNIECFFTDLIYRYSLKKKNIDFEIQCNNIFNVQNYQTVNISSYSYIETNFKLRQRQIFFKVRFSL